MCPKSNGEWNPILCINFSFCPMERREKNIYIRTKKSSRSFCYAAMTCCDMKFTTYYKWSNDMEWRRKNAPAIDLSHMATRLTREIAKKTEIENISFRKCTLIDEKIIYGCYEWNLIWSILSKMFVPFFLSFFPMYLLLSGRVGKMRVVKSCKKKELKFPGEIEVKNNKLQLDEHNVMGSNIFTRTKKNLEKIITMYCT